MTDLPIPSHFNPATVGKVWRVDYAQRARDAEAWARRHQILPAASDRRRVCLLLIDCQNTFCLPDFELFVAGRSGNGAVEDSARICHFIYRNLGRITQIAATLDTHTAYQIFHPVFWVNDRGEHPVGAQTIIELEDLDRGTWRVNPAVADVLRVDYDWLREHAFHYVRSLAAGRYPLMVWPYHAMVGGIGHALLPAIEEAAFFHAVARGTQTRFEVKGHNPLTENYSALSPEVLDGPEGRPIAPKNAQFVEWLLDFDAIVVVGQAKSHCVAWTVHDFLAEIKDRDPKRAEKIYLLEDCTSPVVVPGVVDFTEQADAAFERCAEAGMHVVKSTEPLEVWAGLNV